MPLSDVKWKAHHAAILYLVYRWQQKTESRKQIHQMEQQLRKVICTLKINILFIINERYLTETIELIECEQ